MTALVPVHTVFGMGAPLRKRGVWSGAERRNRALVGAFKEPFRLWPKPSAIQGFAGVAHNGVDAYVAAYSIVVYSTPDLVVGVTRGLPASPTGVGLLTAFKGAFYYLFPVSGGTTASAVSTDKGVTWVAGPVNGFLSVAAGMLYSLAGNGSANFHTVANPGEAAVARALSRAGYWYRVVGAGARRYAFGAASSTAGTNWTLGDVSTNGTSFSQDAGYEVLAARAAVPINHACALADGRVMAFGVGPGGMYCLVAEADGTWSVGARMPAELGDGYRLHSAPSIYSSMGAQAFTDADGLTHFAVLVRDAVGNYLPRVARTYDGRDIAFLPPPHNFGASPPTEPLGVFSTIDGRVLLNVGSAQLVESNENGVELYYEV